MQVGRQHPAICFTGVHRKGGGLFQERRRRVIDESTLVDWKNVDWLRRFLSEQGRILPRWMTGNSQQRQREIARAIKRARHMALLPFVGLSEY